MNDGHGINSATPADWDRLQREYPAIDPNNAVTMEAYHKLAEEEQAKDMVNSPSHYTAGNIECIEAIEASMTPEAFRGYCKANVLKYLWRYEKKGKPLECLEKSLWYLERLKSSYQGQLKTR